MASGVWNGRKWTQDSSASAGTVLCWVLSLTDSQAKTSAFGASREHELLRGTYSLSEQKVSLSCVKFSESKEREVTTFKGRLRHSAGSLTIQGTWQSKEENGQFILGFEEESGSFSSGVWLGQATPDESLAPFCIPTNPIRWVACFMPPPATGGSGAVFGAGYFDDAAEAQHQNGLLCFLVKGTTAIDQDSPHKLKLELVKQYEPIADVETFPVTYSGVLDTSDLDKEMQGKWNNEGGGSFGHFRCRRTREAPPSSLHFCRVCDNGLPSSDGDVRYVCFDCPSGWECCASCCENGKLTSLHCHELHEEQAVPAKCAEGETCRDIVLNALFRFARRPLVGDLVRTDSDSPTVRWLSYEEIGKAAKSLALTLQETVLRTDKQPLVLVGNLSPEYVVVALASVLAGGVFIPLDPLLGQQSLAHCLELIRPCIVFADPGFQPVEGLPAMVVRISGLFPAASVQPPLELPFTRDLCALTPSRGRVQLRRPAVGPEDTLAILFTSGTTGFPKGAAYTDRLCKPADGLGNTHPLVRLDLQTFHPSFLISLLGVMQTGGRRVFCTDPTRWLSDVVLARPTHISAPPLFWSALLHEHSFLASTAGVKRADEALRKVLGNRVVSAHTGGAAVAPAVVKFFRALGVPLDDLYGCREAGGIAKNGVIYPGVEVRIMPLEPAEEKSGESNEQVASGQPGEVFVHTGKMIPEYIGNTESTEAAFVTIDDKRFYRTGDVGCLSEDGKLMLLGRVGAGVKLDTSKWLHPTKVETVLESGALVHQALVFASPGKSFPVAVVVLSAFGRAQSQEHTDKDWLLNELRFWCAHSHLEPQETPQAVYVEQKAWSEGEGLLTPTLKKKRAALLEKYAAVFPELYLAAATANNERGAQLSEVFSSALARAGVTVEGGGLTPNVTLAEIGANSLAVARLVQLFRESKVELSVKSMYVQPLSYLDSLLARAQRGELVAPAEPLQQTKLNVGEHKFAPNNNNSGKEPQRASSPSAVLITGGTGFFGSYLIPKVLEAFPTNVVYVLVRGSAERSAAWLQSAKKWQGCERLRPISGDVALPQLGLSVEVYKSVSEAVGDVFHCAARVDIAAPVEALLETNVEGTKRVIELCLLAKAKLHYFSSLSAMSTQQQEQQSPGEGKEEAWHVIVDEHELSRKTGYGASKALAERLVHTAMLDNGLEARVIRTGTVCGDSHKGAAWNTNDFFYLLLKFWADAGVVVAPSSLPLRWLPAPYVASVMVALAQAPSAANRCFSLVGNGPSLSQLSDQLQVQLRGLGRSCRVVEPSRWAEEVFRIGGSENKLVVEQFAKVKFITNTDTQEETPPTTQAELGHLNLPIPRVGEEFAAACIAHLLTARSGGPQCIFCGRRPL